MENLLNLEIIHHIAGPLQNNCYIVFDKETLDSVIIDPGFGPENLINDIKNNGLNLNAILLTHAHFDHVSGIDKILNDINVSIPIALHKDDLNLLQDGGGAKDFGLDLIFKFKPSMELIEGQNIKVGNDSLSVLHTPGHTPGHVTFYSKSLDAAFCGDLIFYHSVGRTDLVYSDNNHLINSIRTKIYTLPPQTILYNGHGLETTVAEEIKNNPFV